MHPETSLFSRPRPPLAKRRRRALGTLPSRAGETLFALRRHSRAGGDFSHRPPAGAHCAVPSAPPATRETALRAWAERIFARSAPVPELAAHQEILRGAAIGILACLVFACLAGASPLSLVAAVIWGSSVGALIGMLLWVGSVEAPEDPIPPPPPGQARGEKSDKPRPRH